MRLLKSIIISLCCFSFLHSGAIDLKPNAIDVPKNIKAKKLPKILTVFNDLEKKHKKSSPTLWAIKYKKSLLLKKKDINIFCKGMKELSDIKTFPLHQLALLHFYESCPSEKLDLHLDNFPSWMHMKASKTFYNKAKKQKNTSLLLESSQYLGKNSKSRSDRIHYLKEAISYAKKLKSKDQITALQNNLYKEAPYLKPNPQFEDYLPIANSLRRARKFTKATRYYKIILNSPKANFEQKNESFKWIHWIYKVRKRYKKQLIASKQWASWLLKVNTKESLSYYYDNQLDRAIYYWNYNENKKALDLIDEIVKLPEASQSISKAYWIRSLIHEEEKQLDKSLKDLEKVIKSTKNNYKERELLNKSLWKKAWILRKQKKYKESLSDLHKLKNITKSPYVKYKAIFWIGETHRQMGYKVLSRVFFQEVSEKDFFGYYGLMARYRLSNNLDIKAPHTNLKSITFKAGDNSKNIVHWLLFLNEKNLLSQFLNSKKNIFNKHRALTTNQWVNLSYLYLLSENYIKVFQSLEKMPKRIKKHFIKNHIDFLFPLVHLEEFEKASKRFEIPKSLPLSIARQESAFNPFARSKADAFGLMQLIPSTARENSRKLGLTYRGYRQLYQPDRSILLGSNHIKWLLKKYDKNFILSTAAYNAGTTPVNRWLAKSSHTTAFEFIENIPYAETKTYVRLLIRNYIFYHNLLKENFKEYPPEWILKNPETGKGK